MSVVGIDLAGVETRPTGFCKLIDTLTETCDIYTDKEIVEKTFQAVPKLVAIDAPLYLPPGRVSIEDRSGPHLRDGDRELIKMHIKFFPVTLGPMRKLTVRGIKLRGIFEKEGLRVVEAYPGGAQDILGIVRKQHGMDKLLAGLQALGIRGLDSSMSDHVLDAVTCAYVGKQFLEGKAVSYGAPNEGIVLPKRKE